MNIDETILSNLSDEQKKKIEAASSREEYLALAKEFGYPLSSEQLDSIAGGNWCSQYCPDYYYCKHDAPL